MKVIVCFQFLPKNGYPAGMNFKSGMKALGFSETLQLYTCFDDVE